MTQKCKCSHKQVCERAHTWEDPENHCGQFVPEITFSQQSTIVLGIEGNDGGHKMIAPIMKHFEYEHLSEKLREISKPICKIAHAYENTLPDSAEKSAGLRKLLEAKDCLVRAAL